MTEQYIQLHCLLEIVAGFLSLTHECSTPCPTQMTDTVRRTVKTLWIFSWPTGDFLWWCTDRSVDSVFVCERESALHLHALVHEGEDVATSNQLFNGASQTLSESTKKIQSYDHEIFVRGFVLVRL